MFRCQECNNPQDSHISPIRKVTHVRKRVYRHDGRESFGSEVVREVDLCSSCATHHLFVTPEVVETKADKAPVVVEEANERMDERPRWRDRRS